MPNIIQYHLCVESKKQSNELVCKINRLTDIENKLMFPKMERRRGKRYTLLYIKQQGPTV